MSNILENVWRAQQQQRENFAKTRPTLYASSTTAASMLFPRQNDHNFVDLNDIDEADDVSPKSETRKKSKNILQTFEAHQAVLPLRPPSSIGSNFVVLCLPHDEAQSIRKLIDKFHARNEQNSETVRSRAADGEHTTTAKHVPFHKFNISPAQLYTAVEISIAKKYGNFSN